MILVTTNYLILLYSVTVDLEIKNNSTQLEHVLVGEGGEQEFVLGTDLADEILRTNEEFPTQVQILYTVGLKS